MNEHAPDLPAALEGLRLQLADTLDGLTAAAVVAALEATVSLTMRPFVPRRRFAGLELVSSEPAWTHGSGERCAGPGSSLLLTLWGRSSGLPELAGPGADLLAERLSAKVPTKPAG